MKLHPWTLVTRYSSLVTALAALAATAGDLYVNDFATRTSKGPIPAIGVWQEAQPYPNAFRFICNRPSANNGSIDFANLASYFSTSINVGDRASCDGWFVPYFIGANGGDGRKLVPRYVSSKPTSAGDQFYTDSDCFSWTYGNSDARRGIAVHGIHNEFTNGQLRLQIDMKAPVTWAARGGRVRVFPVYRKYMDILAWEGTRNENSANVTPGGVAIRGAASGSTSSLARSYPFRFNSSTSTGTQMGNNDSGKFTDDDSDGKTNYWFRYIVTYDLGNNTFGGEIYRFSKAKGYPSFATDPSDVTPYQSFSNEPAWVSLSAETGGIAGLGLAAYGSFADGTDPSVKVLLDNIRMSWKAPGTSDFEVFYENDFTTRRYRTLSAPSTTTGSYSQSTASANEADTYTYPSFSGNLNTRMLIPGAVNGTSASQPVGLDSWKKLPYRDHAGGGGNAAVHAYGGTTYDAGGAGGNMLTYGDQGNFSIIGQTLGKVFTTGKVKISVDARLPEGDRLTTSIARRRMAVGLGSLALYDTAATSADACAQIAAGFGYHRLNNTGICSSKPYTLAAYSSGDEPNRDYPASYTAPDTNAWYRMVVEADLDAKTYDVSMTPLGTASVLPDYVPVASPIFTATDLPFAANVTDIGSFYLYGYGYGAATTASYIQSRVCFDNVRVWHNSDLIYENDFTTRTRTLTGVTREAGDLAALQYNLDGGQDHWVRRDYIGPAGFDARAWVRDENGNTFLALGRSSEEGSTITLGNSLGVSQEAPFRFEADIRPPAQWSAANGGVTLSLGDSQMAQIESPETFSSAHRLVTFGFDGTDTANTTLCPFYFAGCKAKVGGTELDAEIDTTHWYRFRLEVNPGAGTYSAQVRDMGAAHPTPETKGGTVVASVANVPFDNAMAAGESFSTILIEGKNLSGAYGSLGVDPAHVLIDNLRLFVPNPFTLIVR